MGGLLLQTKQIDSKHIWNNLSEKIISNNLDKLLADLECFLSNTKKCNEVLESLENKFSNSKRNRSFIKKILKLEVNKFSDLPTLKPRLAKITNKKNYFR